MKAIADWVTQLLQPQADFFSSLNLPEVVTHWGHPFFMSIVVLVMGTSLARYGFEIRTSSDVPTKAAAIKLHKRTGPFFTLFISLGFLGGLLSLVMQGKPIMESPHFWTGCLAIAMVAANGAISFSKFLGGKPGMRTVHAYLGVAALGLLLIHGLLGLQLGLSI